MLGVCKVKYFWLFSSNGGVFGVGWFAWSLSFAVHYVCVCVCGGGDTMCAIHKAHFPSPPRLAQLLSSLHSAVVVLS